MKNQDPAYRHPDRQKTLRNFCVALLCSISLSGCGYLRIDPWHPLIRSDVLENMDDHKRIVDKARLEWTADGKMRVLYVSGTPYERGYQQGVLLRDEIQENVNYIYRRSISKFGFQELFDEAYERMRPFIPQEYIDEMHGLAHGSKMPLSVIHGFHALPSITEWGGKRKIKEIVNQMMEGALGTSCSNLALNTGATADGAFYAVRILDWGLHRISRAHEFPLITINVPETGFASANIGWVGFLGAVSGMNEQGITLGEMGYGNPPDETLRGMPMPFMLRNVLAHASSLSQVREIISGSPGDCSFVYLMTDGKTREAELYIRDKDRFLVHKPGDTIKDGDDLILPIPGTIYGGHYNDVMTRLLTEKHGTITPEMLMTEMIPPMAMKSNFQNVIYEPALLRFWVANAKNSEERAAEQPYTPFDLDAGLKRYREGAIPRTTDQLD